MKTAERQHLKQNELADTITHVRALLQSAGPNLGRILLAVLIVGVIVGGFFAWRSYRASRAEALLAAALTVAGAPVTPPAPAAVPGQPAPPPPQAGSFPTEQARSEAAIARFAEAANAYSSTDAGRMARYRLAALYADQGKLADAEREFKALADAAASSLHGRMARLGLADLQVRQGQFDAAIATYRELATRTDGDLPVDAVLMQLGRAQSLAGKKTDALQTFRRVVDEFPQSVYLGDARREAEAIEAAGGGR
jgi:predicted negative regulator of RcsB-dependent stress response